MSVIERELLLNHEYIIYRFISGQTATAYKINIAKCFHKMSKRISLKKKNYRIKKLFYEINK